jgi:hypothetical protein
VHEAREGEERGSAQAKRANECRQRSNMGMISNCRKRSVFSLLSTGTALTNRVAQCIECGKVSREGVHEQRGQMSVDGT